MKLHHWQAEPHSRCKAAKPQPFSHVGCWAARRTIHYYVSRHGSEPFKVLSHSSSKKKKISVNWQQLFQNETTSNISRNLCRSCLWWQGRQRLQRPQGHLAGETSFFQSVKRCGTTGTTLTRLLLCCIFDFSGSFSTTLSPRVSHPSIFVSCWAKCCSCQSKET